MGYLLLAIGGLATVGSLTFAAVPMNPAPGSPAAPAALAGAGDVRSRGAKGDGATDDTAAIQAACAAGGDVFLPAGTYAVTRPIALSGPVRIQGSGATIVSSEPTGALFRASGDLTGFVMRDVVLRTTRKDLEKRGEALFSVDHHSLDGALFENVTFDTGSSYQNAISLAAQVGTHIENVTIRNCSFTGPSAGVEFVHHVDAARRIVGIKILHNRFAHNGAKDDQNAGFGISLSGPLSRVDVIGNDIRGYPYAGIEIVAPKAGGFEANYVIQANTMVATGRGIITDTSHAGPSGRISRVSIDGNIVVGNRFFQRLQGLADSVVQGNVFDTRHAMPSPDHQHDFFSFSDCDRILVANNAFRLDLPPSEAGKAFVALQGVKDSHISGNRLESTGVHVICIGSPDKPSTGNSFSGNMFVHRDNGAYSDPVAFRGTATTRNVLNASTLFRRHENAVSSQAAGNIATGTVTANLDSGAPASSKLETFAIPPAGTR